MFIENSFLQAGNSVTLHSLVHVLFFFLNKPIVNDMLTIKGYSIVTVLF